MNITREIDGKLIVFELTNEELYNAFREQEFRFDRNDIEDYFYAFDEDELQEEYDMSRAEIEELFDDMAHEMRRNMDKYEMSWDYARDHAIADILRKERV